MNMNRVLYHEWFPQIVYDHHQTGPRRHGDVRAAVPRSVQLRLRSADPRRHRSGWRGHARALRRRGQARRDDARRLHLLDVVERRPADDRVLPQPDRPAHRDDRRARRRPRFRSCPSGSCRAPICRIRSRRSRGASASRSTTRSRRTAPCSTSPRATARRCSINIYRMGRNAIERGSRDTWTPSPRRVEAARADAGGERHASTPAPSSASSATRASAMRAATSCRRISRTS